MQSNIYWEDICYTLKILHAKYIPDLYYMKKYRYNLIIKINTLKFVSMKMIC